MKYSVFSAFARGYAHARESMPCQDYAAHYRDEQGRFAIAVACDGHSDRNCFRSDRGAKFGCEATIEVLKAFFEFYFTLDGESRRRSLEREEWIEKYIERIKKVFIPKWNEKVQKDLERDAFTEKELAPLSQRVRDLYLAGKHTRDIHGATLQACAVCEDFHLVMQIGDGVILALYPEGCYDEPLPEDKLRSYGQPASICDEDLLSRPEAFRITIVPGIPVGMFATSDGMGGLPRLRLVSALQHLQERIADPADPEDSLKGISEEQQTYIQNMVAFYADKDHGEEDDCSIAGFILRDAELAPFRLTKEEAEKVVADIDERLQEEERRVAFADQNRRDYLRKQNARISELEAKSASLKAQLESMEAELALLQKNVSYAESGPAEKKNEMLDTLREYRRKSEAYLRNSRTEAGKPIPHGVLFGAVPAQPAVTDQLAAAETQDEPEASAPVKTEPQGTKQATAKPDSAGQEETQKTPEITDKPSESAPEEEEPAAREEDPDAFTFPLPPEKIAQMPEQPIQPTAARQPEQPVQPTAARQPEQPAQRPASVPVMNAPQTAGSPDAQGSVSRGPENMYVVPDDQLLQP